MQRTGFLAIAAALALPVSFACHPAPVQQPMRMGAVDTGPASLEAVRRQLTGTWELTALELVSPDGVRTAAQATGRLRYDEFGNLAMQGTITGGPQIDPSVLNLSGRVVIDPVAHTLQVQGITAATADERLIDPQLDATRVRGYAFEGDLLRITIRAADGSTRATAVWKKVE